MSEDELLQTLQALGLTKYQSMTYIAAVESGQARPGDLADESGVPQGRIYDVIDTLEGLGLLEIRTGRNGKEVIAPPPEAVLDDLKRRRVDELTDTVSTAVSELERLHQRDRDESNEFVSMVKRKETALRHARQAIERAEYWLTICVPAGRYDELEPELEKAAERGVTVQVVSVGTDPEEVGRQFPDGFRVRYRATADVFVVADRTYGIYSSQHPARDRQPYIITQEQNLALLFQNYGQQVWDSSAVIQEVTGFPRRYLDPWRAIHDLSDDLATGREFVATVEGRRTETSERGTWTGPIVEYDIGGPTDVNYLTFPPTYASFTLETDDGPVRIGGWKATLEDVAATGLEISPA